MDVSTQIMEFEDTQAYKTFEKGVLVWKSEIMEPRQPVFNNGSFMLKPNDERMCLTASINLNAK